MNADFFLDAILHPGCDQLSRVMDRDMGSPQALVLLMAIAMQESGLMHRRQVGGPARGWWQFESMGGVFGVMNHSASQQPSKLFCALERVPWKRSVIHEALAWHDPLAVVFARLLLWTDPRPLPIIGDQAEAWSHYSQNWRPGKPRPAAWPNSYQAAVAAVSVRP